MSLFCKIFKTFLNLTHWYPIFTFIWLRDNSFKNFLAREASFQEALALAERREVEKKGSSFRFHIKHNRDLINPLMCAY